MFNAGNRIDVWLKEQKMLCSEKVVPLLTGCFLRMMVVAHFFRELQLESNSM